MKKDPVLEGEIHQAFLEANVKTLGALRKLVRNIVRASEAGARGSALAELYRRIHSLTGNADLCGVGDVAQLAAILGVFLKDLMEQPASVNESILRTIASAVDFIGELFKVGRPRSGNLPPIKILIVDDECFSRRAIVYALKRTHLKFEAVDVEDPVVALKMAKETFFDLIFLDVQMPGLDGFDLCAQVRAFPLNKSTPIIFVTSLSDFKSRAKSASSGGADLIAKPFLFMELALKSIMILLRQQLCQLSKAA